MPIAFVPLSLPFPACQTCPTCSPLAWLVSTPIPPYEKGLLEGIEEKGRKEKKASSSSFAGGTPAANKEKKKGVFKAAFADSG